MKAFKNFLKKNWVLILIILVILGAWWSQSGGGLSSSQPGGYAESYDYYDDYYDDDYDYGYEVEEMALAEPRASSTGTSVTTETTDLSDYDQKIIKTGSLDLHVSDVQESADQISQLVESWGGSVLSSNVYRGDTSYSAWLSVRVPLDRFDESMDELKALALYVNYEYSNAEDVTEHYIDLEARLKNLVAEEEQYLSIMDIATTVEEVLDVTDALYDVRYEIESIESSLAYYDTRINYSTIEISLTEDESVTVVTERWRFMETVREAYSDWVEFLQDVVDDAIYLVIYVWPLALIFLIVWLWKRKKRRR